MFELDRHGSRSLLFLLLMTTELFLHGQFQAVQIPEELQLEGVEVSIRRLGDGLLIEPVKGSIWPESYFTSIRISDSGFEPPDQGELPLLVT